MQDEENRVAAAATALRRSPDIPFVPTAPLPMKGSLPGTQTLEKVKGLKIKW